MVVRTLTLPALQEYERRQKLKKEAKERARRVEEEANKAWKRRVSMRGGHHGSRVTDDIIDEYGVTLVEEDVDDQDDSEDSSSEEEIGHDATGKITKRIKRGKKAHDVLSRERYWADITTFQNVLFEYMMPPERADGPLVRHVFSIFSFPMPEVNADGDLVSQKTAEHTNAREAYIFPGHGDDRTFASHLNEESIPIVDGHVVDCQELIVFLSSMLLVQHMGFTTEILDKAAFYFYMYDIDGDNQLSRTEIYEIMSHSHGELGKRIRRVHQTLQSIDVDGDGVISFEEYLEAAKKNAWLEELLSMNL